MWQKIILKIKEIVILAKKRDSTVSRCRVYLIEF